MDERLRISLWMVGGGGLGAVLGGAFGGLTGALYSRSGRSAGTRFARGVADALTRTAEREPSVVRQGAIIGAADGVLFLGLVGTLAGAFAAIIVDAEPRWLGLAALGSALLVGAAAFFGVLAYALSHNGVGAILYVFVGGMLGAFTAGILLGADHSLLGAVPGLVAGLTLSFVMRRYAPAFQTPRVGAVAPRLRSDIETDITRPPHPRQGNDSFRKPDAFEEE